MNKLLANPTVRLALRAVVAGAIAAATLYHSSGGTIAWKALAVAGGLAFAEVFTPLNAFVGVFKTSSQKATAPPVAPPAAAPPPG